MSFQYTSGDPSHLVGGSNASMADIQGPFTDLKTFLNNRIAAIPTLVSSLPVSPSDGQEIYYQADGTNGIIWHLRYRSASASSFKWEFVGGSALSVEATASTNVNPTTGGWQDPASAGPDLVAPLSGEYELSLIAAVSHNGSSNALVFSGVTTVGGTPTDVTQELVGNGVTQNLDITIPKMSISLTSGTTYRQRYGATGTGVSVLTLTRRSWSIRPRRVG